MDQPEKYEPPTRSGKYEEPPPLGKAGRYVLIFVALGLVYAVAMQSGKSETEPAPEKYGVDCTGLSDLRCMEERMYEARRQKFAEELEEEGFFDR